MKFVRTRVMLVSSIGVLVVGTWSAITISAAREETTPAGDAATEAVVIEQDGWRWDESLQDWVLIAGQVAESTPGPALTSPQAPQQVVVVERQQEVHHVYYVYEVQPTQAAPAGRVALPPATPAGSRVATAGVDATPSPSSGAGDPGSPPPAIEPQPQPAAVMAAPSAIPVQPEPTQEPPVVLPTQPPPVAIPPTPVPPPPTPVPPPPTAPPAPAPKPTQPASKGS